MTSIVFCTDYLGKLKFKPEEFCFYELDEVDIYKPVGSVSCFPSTPENKEKRWLIFNLILKHRMLFKLKAVTFLTDIDYQGNMKQYKHGSAPVIGNHYNKSKIVLAHLSQRLRPKSKLSVFAVTLPTRSKPPDSQNFIAFYFRKFSQKIEVR